MSWLVPLSISHPVLDILMCTIVDIDECAVNRRICGTGGTCVNRAGSYTCQCNSGYRLRNRKCEGAFL